MSSLFVFVNLIKDLQESIARRESGRLNMLSRLNWAMVGWGVGERRKGKENQKNAW